MRDPRFFFPRDPRAASHAAIKSLTPQEKSIELLKSAARAQLHA